MFAGPLAGSSNGVRYVSTTHVPANQQMASDIVRPTPSAEKGEEAGRPRQRCAGRQLAPENGSRGSGQWSVVSGITAASSFNRGGHPGHAPAPAPTFKRSSTTRHWRPGIDPGDLVIDEPFEVARLGTGKNFGGEFFRPR